MNRSKSMMGVVFFCLIGWVCTGPVLKANGQNEADSNGGAKNNIFAGSEESTTPSATASNETAPASTTAPAPGASENVEKPQQSVEDLANTDAVKVGTFGEIDLHVKDLEISTVLQLLSLQAKRNVIATKDVSGTVTADLFGVGFYEALDAILQPNGFGYREKGKFIYVYTLTQLEEIRKQEEKPVVRVIRLNYLNATDASTFVTPLLSGAGSIALSGQVPVSLAPTTADAGGQSSAHQDTLVVRDLQGNVDQVLGVIKELDIRPRQVKIKATVLTADMSETNAFGVDVTVIGGASVDDFTNPLSVIDELNGQHATTGKTFGAQSTAGNALSGPSNVRVGFVAGSVEAFVRALDEVTDTTVLANPELLVLNRQRADLLIGGRLGYISTQQTETATTQTVEFLDVGTQLTVRPFVSDDGMVRLEIQPSVSTGFTELRGGFVIPNTETQELTTNVMVQSGKTVVIGGLFQEDTQVTRSQVPGVGDIPIIGNAFKGVDDASNRSEVIFMITPTIVKDSVVYNSGNRALENADLAMLGARQGLLPWSRNKQTAHEMQMALEAYRSGNQDKALFHADKALHLDPTIIDARRIRANVAGDKRRFYNRSILKNIVDANVDDKVGTPAPKKAADAKQNAKPEAKNQAKPSDVSADGETSDHVVSDADKTVNATTTTTENGSGQAAVGSSGDFSDELIEALNRELNLGSD